MTSQNPTPDSLARDAMLNAARVARTNGRIYLAIATYEHLLADYPTTTQSYAAAREMIALAQFLEQQGMLSTAMTLYQRLDNLR